MMFVIHINPRMCFFVINILHEISVSFYSQTVSHLVLQPNIFNLKI